VEKPKPLTSAVRNKLERWNKNIIKVLVGLGEKTFTPGEKGVDQRLDG
jgi:hypothetical protein